MKSIMTLNIEFIIVYMEKLILIKMRFTFIWQVLTQAFRIFISGTKMKVFLWRSLGVLWV